MTTISEILDPNREPRQTLGLKAESVLNRISFTPSSASPGETLIYSYSTIIRKHRDCSW